MELTDSWESQLPAVKVSIFKAHQLQWEGSRAAHMPALTVKQEKLSPIRVSHKTNTHTRSGQTLCKEFYQNQGVIVNSPTWRLDLKPLSYLHECHSISVQFCHVLCLLCSFTALQL